ncbi:hypothetical protein R7P07_11530 [Vibrio sp. Vb2133]|uniref:hypothetical protein n=1 Tax=Vibrio TaxID=662 RepID=UPI0028DAB48F|nr:MULTISPECIES: hypothetical protein [unclassified Vibrio]ELJ8795498.1 hypothetical protein [Vibrio parahaemolyticus]MDW1748963.1 hypothetical protein [Vibrio sp. Vb2133]MDW1790968.1 hypothetical protein [Vibrio sp. Vb2132]MDW3148664.1 hypothetical protein [Vibrio sp. 2132-1]HCE1951719.1 hypothetical protein [Vibrio parahaemolyticus]
MADGKQESIAKFFAWKESTTTQECKNIWENGQLNRVELSKVTDITRSAFYQNNTLKELVKEYEKELLKKTGFSSKSKKSNEARTTKHTDTKPRSTDISKMVRLEARIQELESQNLQLKARLERYAELEEVISQMGGIL